MSVALMIASAAMTLSAAVKTPGLIQFPLAVTLLLIANVLILLDDVRKNIVFLAFQGTFFLFLIAGPLLEAFDGKNFFNVFSQEMTIKTYVCYWLAALAMWIYCFVRRLTGPEIRLTIYGRKKGSKEYPYELIRRYAKIAFYVAIAAYFLLTMDKILYRQDNSLLDYYAEYTTSSHLPGPVVKIADCYLIAFMLFLATRPSKRETILPMLLFLMASALTLLYGVRNVFILNFIFAVIYFVIRNGDGEEIWLPKRFVVLGLVLLPVAMVLLQAFDVFRRNAGFNASDLKELFSFSLVKDFFVSQSVSSDILPYAMKYADKLGGQPVPYMLGTLYTYLRQNMIVRFFTGAAAFTANSAESALVGGNLGARLAYHMFRDSFLSGVGMGGSYTAELFVDFSYPGVFIGTLIACGIINRLSRAAAKRDGSPFTLAFVLVAVRWMAYLPRDSYFAWAMQAFSFMNILFVLLMLFLSHFQLTVSIQDEEELDHLRA